MLELSESSMLPGGILGMPRLSFHLKLFIFMTVQCVSITSGFASEKKSSESIGIVQESQAAFIEAKDSVALLKTWGVRLISVQLTAASHMLDFRFQVLNTKKAEELLDRKNKPLMLVENGKVQLEVPNAPFVGSLRQSSNHIKDGTVLNILFGNPGKMVVQGQPVNILIGRFSVRGLIVGDLLNPMPIIKRVARKAVGHV